MYVTHTVYPPCVTSSNSQIQATLSTVLKAAWTENPRLAVQLTSRFTSARLATEVRSLFLRYPERAIEEPDTLQILIGASLPTDLSFQLKVCSNYKRKFVMTY